MTKIKTVKARYLDGTIEECSIEISQGPQWRLVFSGAGLQGRQFSDGDLFDLFTSLRKTLEESGVQLLCAGSRPDVFPSGMSRQMGGGRKAYVTKLGRPALRTDLVDIFDYSDAKSVGSVSEQLAFHEKWIASLRK
jgi:hypothetical protein